MDGRPSPKEISGKIAKARKIVDTALNQVIIIDRLKWDEDWERLRCYLGFKADEIALAEDRFAIVKSCFGEIGPNNHLWRGVRLYCNKSKFTDVELWEFRWISEKFLHKELYMKFGFRKEWLCFLSFHPDEPERRVRK